MYHDLVCFVFRKTGLSVKTEEQNKTGRLGKSCQCEINIGVRLVRSE